MYVTAGLFKGRRGLIPDSAKPTLSKTRESVFNVLNSMLDTFEDKMFLDLFSGSGIMSLEALSRGFKTISVDKNHKAVSLIKQNLKVAQKDKYQIIQNDSLKFIKTTGINPDVVYIDPPWNIDYKNIIKAVYEKFNNVIMIVESDKKTAQDLSAVYAEISMPIKEKIYGRCKLDFLIKS